MAISRIKQIKRILKDWDVRDPRGALDAIKEVTDQPKPAAEKPAKPLLEMTLNRFGNKVVCAVKFDPNNLKPIHVAKTIESLKDFANDVFSGECDDPNCPVHGDAATDLGELFKKFEEAAIAEAKKGKLQ